MANKKPIVLVSGRPANIPAGDVLDLTGTDTYVLLDEHASAPSTPATGTVALYAKQDGSLYSKDDAGAETQLGGGGGSQPANQIVYGTGSGVTSESSFWYDSTNDTEYIGPTTSPYSLTNSRLVLASTSVSDTANTLLSGFAHGQSATINLARANNTLASPTTVALNDTLAKIVTSGHDGTSLVNNSGISFVVDGTVSTGTVPSRIEFVTTADTSANKKSQISIDKSGNLNFIQTGQKITGEFNTTNRVLFQNSITNANTYVSVVPNGTGIAAGVQFYDSSTPFTSNASTLRLYAGTLGHVIASEITNSGTYRSINFQVNLATQVMIAAGVTAANYLTFQGGAASNPVKIGTDGSDTDISIRLAPKGTGVVAISRNATTNVSLSGATDVVQHMIGADGAAVTTLVDAYNNSSINGATLLFRRSRGTGASPHGQVLSGDRIGAVAASANTGSAFAGAAGAIFIYAAENCTAGAQGAYMTVETTKTGTTTRLEQLRVTDQGHLQFSQTGQRITGDFSNATITNRLMFQTSTTNGNATVGIIPNGTGNAAGLAMWGASNPTNAPQLNFYSSTSGSVINSAKQGTGTTQSLYLQIDSATNVQIPATGITAVNYLNLQGSIASNPVKISTDGSDTDISIRLAPKGAGSIIASRNATTNIGLLGATDVGLQIQSADNASVRALIDTFNNSTTSGSTITFRRTRGTGASPHVAVASGDGIGFLGFIGNNGTAYTGTVAAIAVTAAENFTLSANGSYITLETTKTGTTTRLEQLRVTDQGHLQFSQTGQRITGDFSNATITNRLMLQTSTTNSSSGIIAIPNGTGTGTYWIASNNSTPTNSGVAILGSNIAEIQIKSDVLGSGTLLPLRFYMHNTTPGIVAEITTSGHFNVLGSNKVSIGLTAGSTPNEALEVAGTTSTGGRAALTDAGGANRRALLMQAPAASGNQYARILGYDYQNATGLDLVFNDTASANVVIGGAAALATSATKGFLLLPTMSGTPTGAPTTYTNTKMPIVIDSSTNSTYGYTGSVWVQLSSPGVTTATPNTIAKRDGSADLYANNFVSSSDEQLKKDIKPITNALDTVSLLEGVTFVLRSSDKASAGVIAQQIETVLPDLVYTDPETGLKSVNYLAIIGYLIEAIKELKQELHK